MKSTLFMTASKSLSFQQPHDSFINIALHSIFIQRNKTMLSKKIYSCESKCYTYGDKDL